MARCLLLIAALLVAKIVYAEDVARYTPEELYQYQLVQADNGFRAILNHRGDSPNAAMRLIVNVGSADLPCDKRELPHLVEHLLFSGYGDFDEAGLDNFIQSLGGSWNAFTYDDRTSYHLDIYSDNAFFGLVTWDGMLRDTVITQEELEHAREMVISESGGEPGFVEKALHRNAILEGGVSEAYRQFAPDSVAFCDTPPGASHITLQDVTDFIETYYVPQNMVLIAVGQMDIEDFTENLLTFLGDLPSGDDPPATPVRNQVEFEKVDYETATQPLFGKETYISLEYGVPQFASSDRAALILIKQYLDIIMYERLRLEESLSYDPGATFRNYYDFSTLELSANVFTGNENQALDLMRELVRDVRENGLSEAVLKSNKKVRLYMLASAFEANGDFAYFYENYLPYFRVNNDFPSMDSYFSDVTSDDVRRVAELYLSIERSMTYIARPALTPNTAAAVIVLILIGGVALVLIRRRSRTNHSTS